jgi:hypothetical protein
MLPLSHTCPHEKSQAKQKDSEKLDMQAQPLTKLLMHWAMELAIILILTLHPSPKQNGSDKQASGSSACPRRFQCSLFFIYFVCVLGEQGSADAKLRRGELRIDRERESWIDR